MVDGRVLLEPGLLSRTISRKMGVLQMVVAVRKRSSRQLPCRRQTGSNPFHPSRGPLAAILRQDSLAFSSSSIILNHRRHQPRSKVLRQTVQRRILLFKKILNAGWVLHVRGNLVLVPETKIVRLITNARTSNPPPHGISFSASFTAFHAGNRILSAAPQNHQVNSDGSRSGCDNRMDFSPAALALLGPGSPSGTITNSASLHTSAIF